MLLREDCHIDFKIDSNSIQNMVIVDIVICGCGEDLLFFLSRNVESGESGEEATRYKVPFYTMGGRRKLFIED